MTVGGAIMKINEVEKILDLNKQTLYFYESSFFLDNSIRLLYNRYISKIKRILIE